MADYSALAALIALTLAYHCWREFRSDNPRDARLLGGSALIFLATGAGLLLQ
ncbi:MAG: hypothetical protein LH632_09700 [Rhodoferax sp.]|nr:hypothetical protein [Rhodoferax sp.]